MIILRRLVALTCLTLLTGCHTTGPMGTESLADLKNAHATATPSSDGKNNNVVRSQALQDTALSIGAQSGLAWRSNQINAILQSHSKELDQVFNFNRLMLPNHVLPPVLEMSEKSMRLDGMNAIRLSDQTYLIQSQARFVTAPPNWRDYLWMNFKAPPLPIDTMLPKTRDEQKVWAQYTAMGWQQGIQQANTILQGNLARLTRDTKGMLLYSKLLAEGMVSQPFVERNNLGITGGGDTMHINDQMLRITALPQLEADIKKWHPVVVPETITSNNGNTDD